jgi:hypothetical protein
VTAITASALDLALAVRTTEGISMEQQTRLTEQRLRLAALMVIAAFTLTLFALGQNAAAVVSVLTSLGLVVNGLWSTPPKRTRHEPEEASGDRQW